MFLSKYLISHNVLDGYSNEQPSFLICRDTVSVDNRTSDRVCLSSASIAGVALNGIDCSVFAFLNNTGVVCHTVALPVKEDDCTGRRLIRAVCPLSSVSEPLYTVYTTGILWNNTGVDISTLIGTPRNKAGTLFYTGVKAIPRPIGLSAHIAYLRQSDRYNLTVAVSDTVKHL